MGWLASFAVAVLTAAAGTFAAGFIAALSVDWYGIPGREGESGYFVVLIALFGLVAGGAIGLIVSRVLAAGPHPGFFRALGLALGIVLVVGSVALGLARGLADVPPEIDGEPLFVAAEIRYPAGSASPATAGDEAVLTLGSAPGPTAPPRKTETGPLWTKDAREVDGRWVVPGVVELFTSRGERVISIAVTRDSGVGFVVPLRAFPKKADLAWSDWLPRSDRGTGPWPADRFSYRYRVQRRSEPIRTDRFGPFEIGTVASGLFQTQVDGRYTWAAYATFTIAHRGKPVSLDSGSADGTRTIGSVAVVTAPEPAIVAQANSPDGSNRCFLLRGDDQLRIEPIGACSEAGAAFPLTADTARFRAARARNLPRGRIDQVTFAEPGLYLMGGAVLDTRRLVIEPYTTDSRITGIPAVPPLGVSPDERSFARFTFAEGFDTAPVIAVTRLGSDSATILPVDPLRMRFANLEAIDPAWLAHHFAWERGPDGADRLVERKDFVPLPYHGHLSGEGVAARTYRIEPAGRQLRAALVEFLVREFKGEPAAADSDAYEVPVRIDGATVNVAASSGFDYVSVTMASGSADTRLVDSIAERFDAALRTGKYDAFFGKPRL